MPTLELAPLTRRQEQILSVIERSQISTVSTPTYREIAAAIGLTSPGSIRNLIKPLYDKAYLAQNKEADARGFKVLQPIVSPRYIGAIDLHDGSLSLGYPKKIPHCKTWEGCVGLELVRDDTDRCRMEGDVLILKPVQGYSGQSLPHLDWWGGPPEQMVFGRAPAKASFLVVGVWRDFSD